MNHRSEPILLVEDDQVDAMIIRRALKQLGSSRPLVHVENGEQALAYLQATDHAWPFVTLLDINMPCMNGIELLQVVRTDARLKALPMVMLTTSDQDRDKCESFALGAAGYILKPVNYREFVETLEVIERYWSLSCRPPADACGYA